MVFDWLVFLFGRTDKSHEQYTQETSTIMSPGLVHSMLEFVGQVAEIKFWSCDKFRFTKKGSPQTLVRGLCVQSLILSRTIVLV